MEQSGSPPHDLAAERAVLGALLLKPQLMAEVGVLVTHDQFYDQRHRVIYRAICDLDERQEGIDEVLLLKRLKEMDMVEESGGLSYLTELANSVPTVVNTKEYVRIVAEKHTLREVIAFASHAAQQARSSPENVPRFLDSMARDALDLSVSGATTSVQRLGAALKEAFDAAEKRAESSLKGTVSGVPSGFHLLDHITSGWQPSDLVILAARPGMGKTAFALNMLHNAAFDTRNPTRGVIFSLEMSTVQLATRMWCASSRVGMEKLRRGELSRSDWDRLCLSMERLIDAPIFIDDTPSLSVTEMMRKCRQLHHEHHIGLIMVDYLQLMTTGNASNRTSREQVISEISRSLKALAKELHVPVIALSQLNRSVESRPDKRPMLSDLRESGAIEQDADIITFLYRDDYYANMKGETEGEDAPVPTVDGASKTEVLIAKHRSGSTGKVELAFHAPYTLFSNLSDGPPPPDEEDVPRQDLQARVDAPPYREPEPDPSGARPFVEADVDGDFDEDMPI